jgi:hypothetical protein
MKRAAATLLKLAVSAGIYVYIFNKVDVRHLWEVLREAKLRYFIAAVALYLLIQALSAYRWYLLLGPPGIEASYGKILALYFVGMYFNFFLPTAIGGDVIRVYYIQKRTRSLSAATASVFLDRDLGMAALLFMALVFSALAGTSFKGMPLAAAFALVMAAFIAANLAIFYKPSYDLLHRLLGAFKMKRADERVERLFNSVNSYRGRWGLIAIAAIISLGVQVGCSMVNLLSARAIDLNTRNGWVDYLVLIPATGLMSMIPISAGGMGWREAAYIVLFSSVGATQSQALALALLWLGVLVATSLPGGIIYLFMGGWKSEADKLLSVARAHTK